MHFLWFVNFSNPGSYQNFIFSVFDLGTILETLVLFFRTGLSKPKFGMDGGTGGWIDRDFMMSQKGQRKPLFLRWKIQT